MASGYISGCHMCIHINIGEIHPSIHLSTHMQSPIQISGMRSIHPSIHTHLHSHGYMDTHIRDIHPSIHTYVWVDGCISGHPCVDGWMDGWMSGTVIISFSSLMTGTVRFTVHCTVTFESYKLDSK